MIKVALLELLVCPETHQALGEVDPGVLRDLNEAIARGDCRNRAGCKISAPLDSGLLREDGAVVYPVRSGLPILLIGEGVPLPR